MNKRLENIQCFGTTFAALVTPRSDYVPLSKVFYSSAFDDEFSDVTIVVENEPIRAHRIILARRCEFFYKMFTSGMRESTETTIPLSGVSKTVFMLLLHYIYTSEIKIDFTNAVELYQAADRFQLHKLQDACAEVAKEKMTTEQAAVFLQQAHDFNCLELKDTCMSFVRDNFAKVSQTLGMKEVTAELMLEIVMGRTLRAPPKKKRRRS